MERRQLGHLEKMPVRVFGNRDEGAMYVANEIASLIKEKNQRNEHTILGLATGNTPLLVYKELIRKHREEGLSFKKVITFNLDEYYPMQPEDLHSYRRFMHENLFAHVDIAPEHIHIPDGSVDLQQIEAHCLDFENKISSYGGIDIQILGIGRTGHIGFNEPGSSALDKTRLVDLNALTREDASNDFIGLENVPVRAITMGIQTILQAKRIFLMAWGSSKAGIIQQTVEEAVTSEVPASYLQKHSDALLVLDESAASCLSRIQTPWLTGECLWTEQMKLKAIIWLSNKTKKPILKTTESDYKQYGLGALLKTGIKAYDLNIEMHNKLQRTITGWPGGKPGSDDKTRPERSKPFPKRIVVFSPHPDDDVISMGGTLIRLVEQGHDVHVAYQTSGNIAVFDDDARRFTEFASAFARKLGVFEPQLDQLRQDILGALDNSPDGGNNSRKVLEVKGLIRQGEAIAACRYSGVKEANIHFLNLPFYETGGVEKNPLSDTDVSIIRDLLQEVKPHQIYAAGDLQDPHGTHAVCLNGIFKALEVVRQEPWSSDCFVWLYRGAWQEWDIEDIDMAVPISPDELMKKRKAIFKHQSQKDSPVFPGSDKREFWQRAEDRNRTTAQLYDQLGLTEYEAIEAFKRYLF